MQVPTSLRDFNLSLDDLLEKAADLTDSTTPDTLHTMALARDDNDPRTPGWLSSTGLIFWQRYKAGHRAIDLERAIPCFDRALKLTPVLDPNYGIRQVDLGQALWNRFKIMNDVSDIDTACLCFARSLLNEPPGTRARKWMGDLGGALVERAVHMGDNADLDQAIDVLQQTVKDTPEEDPNRADYLNNLGCAFQTRFERLGNVLDLQEAISVGQKIVELTPAWHPDRPIYVNNLGNAFQSRFELLGHVSDLDEAISAKRQAVEITPDGHHDKPLYSNNLGNALQARFVRHGGVSDLDEAISIHRQAVELTLDVHPFKPSHLNNLGNALLKRFRRLAELSDLEAAISVQRQAIELTADGHPEKPNYLRNLGNAFEARFECVGNISDLEEAISVKQRAVQLTPDGHPDKPNRLSSLSSAFKTRFDCLGNVSDLETAIYFILQAATLAPDGHTGKHTFLNNLGNTLDKRFHCLNEASDLQSAVAILEWAVNLTPDGHPEKPSRLWNLTRVLILRHRHLGNDSDLQMAINTISTAAQSVTGLPRDRFMAARGWSELSEAINDEQQMLQAYDCAIRLIPRVAWMGLAIEGRHSELEQIGKLVRKAAAAAVRSGEHDRALQWLEQGRSVVWGQSLQLRSPLDVLREIDPIRADRLAEISGALESNATDTVLSAPTRGEQLRALVLEWDALVVEVRELEGLQDLLGPKKVEELLTAATSYPIIVLNAHKTGCDALILQAAADRVIHIALDLNLESAQSLLNALEKVQTGRSLGHTDSTEVERHLDIVRKAPVRSDPDIRIRTLLAELWSKVVKPVLDRLAFSLPAGEVELPRICWCPTGPLAFLPLHAAGLYDNASPGTKVFDYVVSSYTPTITALLQPPPASENSNCPRILAVAQSRTQREMPLPYAAREVDLLRDRAMANAVEIVVTSDESGTVQRVLDEMCKCQWIHFACHGTQDPDNPTRSAFILSDGKLELSEIIKHPLPHAEFAYLSACSTATGDEKLSDEAVHLAAGMMLAGYRSVIATMWTIRDQDGAAVADAVYTDMLKDGNADASRAARALHHAVHKLRSSGARFLAWMPFVHIGR